MYQPKILVVDDDENILSAFRDFLKKEHYGIITASSAEDALAYLGRNHVDILIADVRLKGQSGIFLIMEVKRLLPKLPIIVITGYPDLINERDVKEFGADYFFLKPLDIDRLRDAIRQCLNRRNVTKTMQL